MLLPVAGEGGGACAVGVGAGEGVALHKRQGKLFDKWMVRNTNVYNFLMWYYLYVSIITAKGVLLVSEDLMVLRK